MKYKVNVFEKPDGGAPARKIASFEIEGATADKCRVAALEKVKAREVRSSSVGPRAISIYVRPAKR